MKLLLSLSLFLAFLLCPAACAQGVRNGLSLAASEALPALFPFFVASALLVRSGLADGLSRLASRPLCKLYGLPPASAPAVVLGLTGGYPVGAATASDLAGQKAVPLKDAGRVNLFCNCASPGFCIGLVGLGVFGSAKTGAALYVIHILAALITGLICARDFKSEISETNAFSVTRKNESFAAAFCGAVQQSAGTAVTVTAFLTVFSVLIELIRPVLASVPMGMALTGLLELTNGLDVLPSLPLMAGAKLTLASFLLGFGGLAVHFQARAIASNCGLPMKGFTMAKLLHGAIAAAFTAMTFKISPEALAAFAPAAHATSWGQPLGAVIILLSVFVIWAGKRAGNNV